MTSDVSMTFNLCQVAFLAAGFGSILVKLTEPDSGPDGLEGKTSDSQRCEFNELKFGSWWCSVLSAAVAETETNGGRVPNAAARYTNEIRASIETMMNRQNRSGSGPNHWSWSR